MDMKVSIVVPVYKVEAYIDKCVKSILSQTFTNFELILVNDGSPDGCGKICDKYAQNDSRIQVIHKQNGGLAEARNAGLDVASGDYIGFVDSDDWIESDMYEILYNLCIEHDADIACCTSKIHYKDKAIDNGIHPLVIHERKTAMKAMLEGELYDEVVWTKLFKKDLLEGVRFTVGRIYEDTDFTYKAIHKSKKVCSIGLPKYNYIKRENSTMDRAKKDISIDAVLIYDEMYQFMEEHYNELKDLVAYKLSNSAMVVMNLISYHANFIKHKENYLLVAKVLNKHFYRVIKQKRFPKTVKMLFIAAWINPYIYKILIRFSQRRKAVFDRW